MEASFGMEEYLGRGVLEGMEAKLVAQGWDDVPTLKIMNSQDMDLLNLTQNQKDALELRSYLHDRSLMQYADILESSRKTLVELLSLPSVSLSTQYGMKRGHVARFMDRTTPCQDPLPPSLSIHSREKSRSSFQSRKDNLQEDESSLIGRSKKSDVGHVSSFKGIVAAEPAEPRLCGCVQPPPIIEHVAPYSTIENISVQRLMPEYKVSMQQLVTGKSPPMKASDLWKERPVVLLCIRRPGCVMCRAEAHQLYSKKPIFDALGFKLIAVLHEQIEYEVENFWPRYWGGVVILDQAMHFFRALGGGRLLKEKFITGFLFNPRAIGNYKRAKATGLEQNFKGDGQIKGGLFIIGSGRGGIAYQFIERNFGDWAPISEVIQICTQIQSGVQKD